MFIFNDQIVMITGAAGNLGSAAGKAYLERGAHLILTDHRSGRLAEIFPDLVENEDHLLLDDVDLTEGPSVQNAVARALEHFETIHVLVNTVGGFMMGNPVHETELREWTKMMDLNALSVLNTARAVVPIMLKAGQGSIVHVGARTSLEGKARMGAYSAAKAAVRSLTESMAAELKREGIRVNCVLPGTIDTPPNRATMPDANFERWVKPASLVEVIMFLTSPAARDIHGAAFPVFGR